MNVKANAINGPAETFIESMRLENNFLLKACVNDAYVGKSMNHELLISNFYTPDAKRNTGNIVISIWRDFDHASITVSNKIF